MILEQRERSSSNLGTGKHNKCIYEPSNIVNRIKGINSSINSHYTSVNSSGNFKGNIPRHSSTATWVIFCSLSKSPCKSFEGCFNNMMRISSSKLYLKECTYVLLKCFSNRRKTYKLKSESARKTSRTY